MTALWVLLFIVAYQQLENYVFAPRITSRTMQLHPAIAFGSAIAGAAVLGPIGAILALPAAAVIQAFASTSVPRHDVVESELTDDVRRRHRPWRLPPFLRFHRLSADTQPGPGRARPDPDPPASASDTDPDEADGQPGAAD